MQQIDILKYDKMIMLGDFNVEDNDQHIDRLRTEFSLCNLIKEPTCFKSITNPSCIDHIWVTDTKRFMKSSTFETGLSDYHLMTVTILKSQIPKRLSKIVTYRNYKNFNQNLFQNELKIALESSNDHCYESFDKTFKGLLDTHAPIKQKFVRSNNSPFMSKRLRKEIMLRSRKKNIYIKDPTTENWNKFRLQRNKCTRIIRDAKRNFYSTIDLNILKDNSKFWKTVKSIFSEKI